jgi:hypothetical protein
LGPWGYSFDLSPGFNTKIVITHPYFERRILGLSVSPTHNQ